MTHAPDNTLAAPFVRLNEADAAQIAREVWGIDDAAAQRLDTERDDTFLVADGIERHVLKVAHPLDDPETIDLQCSALTYAARNDPSLPLPRLVPSRDGSVVTSIRGAEAEPRIARLLTYLPGDALQYDLTTPEQRSAIGVAHGRLSLALAEFTHPAASRYLHFDVKQLGTLRPFLDYVSDTVARSDVLEVLDAFDSHVGQALAETRQQIVHHDISADNVLVDYALDEFVTGILDFGDVVYSSIAGDLASAMSYAVDAGFGARHESVDVNPWAGPYDLAAGFQSVRPLTDDERNLLPHLMKVRLAQRLLLNSWLAAADPANAHYTGRTIARATRALRRLLEVAPPGVVSEGT